MTGETARCVVRRRVRNTLEGPKPSTSVLPLSNVDVTAVDNRDMDRGCPLLFIWTRGSSGPSDLTRFET